MTEFFNFAFAPANLFYSLFLCLILFYWLTVILGALDLDFLDFEVDAEVDIDVDVDVDIDADVDVDSDVETEVGVSGAGWFLSSIAFFNIGQVPFMIFLSALAIVMWTTAMIFNNAIGNVEIFFIWFLPIFVASLFINKVFTSPFKAMHKRMNKMGVSKKNLVGKIAKVTLDINQGRPGQAELEFEDHHFLLTVRSDEDKNIPKGSQVILTEYRDDRGDFLVNSFDI
jgi:membrane protein implicated in regulation of membrane protease activity